jgi:hypothetical protein
MLTNSEIAYRGRPEVASARAKRDKQAATSAQQRRLRKMRENPAKGRRWDVAKGEWIDD